MRYSNTHVAHRNFGAPIGLEQTSTSLLDENIEKPSCVKSSDIRKYSASLLDNNRFAMMSSSNPFSSKGRTSVRPQAFDMLQTPTNLPAPSQVPQGRPSAAERLTYYFHRKIPCIAAQSGPTV